MNPSLSSIIPKLPSKNLQATKAFYLEKLMFHQVGSTYPEYLMLARDQIEIHFFLYAGLDVLQNYGMCYIRVDNIEELYNSLQNAEVQIPTLGKLEHKHWRQKEFSITDNDHNLLTFGEGA